MSHLISMEQDYEAVGGLITDTINRYVTNAPRKRRLDDFRSVAAEAFVKAWQSYDPTKSSFETWVRTTVFYALKNEEERYISKHGSTTPTDFGFEGESGEWSILTKEESFSLPQFLLELSPDARLVCSLALERPVEIRVILRGQRITTDRPANVLRAVRICLKNVGWSDTRINRTIQEIRGNLS